MSNMNHRDISNNILRNNLNLVINELFQDLLGYAPVNQNDNVTNQNQTPNNIFNILNTINQSTSVNYMNSYRTRNANTNANNNILNRSSVGRNRFNINSIFNHSNTNNSNNEERHINTINNTSYQNNNYMSNDFNYFTRNSFLNSNIVDNRDIISLRTSFRIIDIDSENENDISYNVFERTYTNHRNSRETIDVSNTILRQTLSSLFNSISGMGNYGENDYNYNYNYPYYNRNSSMYSDLSEILASSLYDKPKYKRKISEKGKEQLIYTKYDTSNQYNINTACPIMQTEFEKGEDVIVLPCHHCFNYEAINTWLNEKPECPVCRYELDSEEVRINDDIENENESNSIQSDANADDDNNRTSYSDMRIRMRNREAYPEYYNFITDFLNESIENNENETINNTNTNTEEEALDEDLEMDLILYYLFDNSSNRI